MKQLFTPTGDRIIGTFEIVPGCALVDGFTVDDDGKNPQPEYAGETKMYWNEQKGVREVSDDRYNYFTVRDGDSTLYLDDDGNEWTLDELTIKDDETD